MSSMYNWGSRHLQDQFDSQRIADRLEQRTVHATFTEEDHAFHGVDIDADESIDPVPGEAGAITGYIHGQLMAVLPLVPVA